MKQFFPTLLLLSFLAAAPAFGQGTTKLLTAESQFSLDIGSGQPTQADSITYDYTYDANGDAVVTLTESWTNGAWENNAKLLSEYDANHNLIHWINQFWSGTTFDNFIQMTAGYDDESNILKSQLDFNLGVWQPFKLSRYYYTEFVSTKAPQLADFQIFPNPLSAVLMLKGEGLAQAQIFDHQGQLLRSQGLSGQAEETLRVGDLPTENYFIQVMSMDGKAGVKPFHIMH